MSTSCAAILMSGLLLSATGLSASVIPVVNPSFETPPAGGFPLACGSNCSFSNATIPGWSTPAESGQIMQSVSPGPLFNFIPDGVTTAFSNGGTISQTVGPTVLVGTVYTLMVELGHRNDLPFTASADLLVGGQTFAATGTPPTPGNWSTFTATFTGSAANVGDTITIQLNTSGVQGNFDNVQLTAVPEPGYAGLLGLVGLPAIAYFRRRRTAR